MVRKGEEELQRGQSTKARKKDWRSMAGSGTSSKPIQILFGYRYNCLYLESIKLNKKKYLKKKIPIQLGYVRDTFEIW